MSYYLGIFKVSGKGTYPNGRSAYVHPMRRMAYEHDGTTIEIVSTGSFHQISGNPTANLVTSSKVLSSLEMALINSDSEAPVVDGPVASWPKFNQVADGMVKHTFNITFPEPRWVGGVFIAAKGKGTAPSYTIEDGDHPIAIRRGWLKNPYVGGITPPPSRYWEDDSWMDGAEGNSLPSFIRTTSDTADVITYEDGRPPTFVDVLDGTHPTWGFNEGTVSPIKAKRLSFTFLVGYWSSGIEISALHIYGAPVYGQEHGDPVTFTEDRVVAFTYADGRECWRDLGFGMTPRKSSFYEEIYVKNITDFKIAKEISVLVDDGVKGMQNDVLLSIDGIEWSVVLDIDKLDPGEVYGPIYIRYRPSADAPLGLNFSRLRLRVEEVE